MSGATWIWVGALLFAGALGASAPSWREGRAGTLVIPMALVRRAAPIDSAASAGQAGALGGSSLLDLESAVDHSGPAGADFWSAHGVSAPGADGDDPSSTVPLRFADLVLPNYDATIRAPDGSRPPAADLFPAELLALDGRRVSLEGFIQPIEGRGSKIVLFALLPFPPSCLFGGTLRPDQQVEASAHALGGVQLHPFLPVRVEGKLSVGEEMDAFGFVRSLYRVEVERVARLQ